MKRFVLAAVGRLMVCGLASAPGVASAQNVVTYHNSPARSGEFIVPGLTLAAARKVHGDANFHNAISGNVYVQPLYWKPASAKVGWLIVATESNLIYAVNANTGAVVWKTQLPAPASRSALPCGDIDPEGVTGTPVIDPAKGTLYLDAMTQVGGALRQKVYALQVTTGKVLAHWPIDVETAMAARHAAFESIIQGERSALQFFGGKLYVNYAGRGGDCPDSHGTFYHGIVVEITPSATPAITGSWETRADQGGIWSQGGVASDGKSLFTTTGNTSGADTWGDGEAVVRLAPGLAHSAKLNDYFTPANWQDLDSADADLGGTMALPLTVPTPPSGTAARILALGKDGHAYLLDAADLGGIGHELANVKVSNSGIVTAQAVYQTATGALVAFTNANGVSAACSGNNITMLKVTGAKVGPISVDWCAPLNGHGAPIITTTNGTGNPLVWVTGAEGDNRLHGFNGLTGKEIFTSASAMQGLRHFSTLIAANRHLYVGADGHIYAFTF
jgi:outer membrane protein assembly factor BamB